MQFSKLLNIDVKTTTTPSGTHAIYRLCRQLNIKGTNFAVADEQGRKESGIRGTLVVISRRNTTGTADNTTNTNAVTTSTTAVSRRAE